MSVVRCSVVVKAPNDLLTRRPFLSGRMTSSYGHGVSGFLDKFIGHRTTDIRHLTSCGLRSFHSSYERRQSRNFEIAGGSAKRKRDSAQPELIDRRYSSKDPLPSGESYPLLTTPQAAHTV